MTASRPARLGTLIGRGLSALPPFRGKGHLVNDVGRIVSRLGPYSRAHPAFGARLEVDLRDRIQRYMWGGCYEVEVVRALPSFLGPGSVFVDIGAHIGFFTMLAAALVGETGQVHAFEPDPVLFQRLGANAARWPQVRLHNMAVSDQTGRVTFYRGTAQESGWGSLLDIPGREARDVSSVSLDDWRRQAGDVRRIDLIKIDAEGCEARIVRRGLATLSALRPALLMELNEPLLEHEGVSGAELIRMLEDIGYRCEHLRSIAGSCGWDTMLCVPGSA